MVDRYCYVIYVFDPPVDGPPTPEDSAHLLTERWASAAGLPSLGRASMAADVRRIERRLLKLALSYPEAWEDHPWGENVVKGGKKLFCFFGGPQQARRR